MTIDFPPVRRLGVENWTPEDFEREKVWRKECRLVADERRKLVVGLGWTFKEGRRYHEGHCSHGLWATPPGGAKELPYREAEAQVERDHPGLLPAWPPRPNLPSTFPLYKVETLGTPIKERRFDLLERVQELARVQAAEDERVYAALDAIEADKK